MARRRYDYDGSEELGANELMDIVKALYPEIDHTTRNMLITKARHAHAFPRLRWIRGLRHESRSARHMT